MPFLAGPEEEADVPQSYVSRRESGDLDVDAGRDIIDELLQEPKTGDVV